MAIEDAAWAITKAKKDSLDLVDKFYADRSQGVFYLDTETVIVHPRNSGNNYSDTIIISGDGNGKAFSATSADDSIASAYVHDGNIVTIVGHNEGKTTITVKDAGSISYAPSEKTINVITVGSNSLSGLTFSEIQNVIQHGRASKMFNVGDRMPVVLNGTVGSLTFSDYTAYAYIIGIDHNADHEGTNRVHFQFGFDAASGGNHIAFVNSNFRMYETDTPTGTIDWTHSYMRNTICQEFFEALPVDLRNVISKCTKFTTTKEHDGSTTTYNRDMSEDKIFLLSHYEICGSSETQIYEKQYDYYKSGNSKIMYKHNNTSSATGWLIRDIYDNNRSMYINYNGYSSSGSLSQANGFAPCFTIA